MELWASHFHGHATHPSPWSFRPRTSFGVLHATAAAVPQPWVVCNGPFSASATLVLATVWASRARSRRHSCSCRVATGTKLQSVLHLSFDRSDFSGFEDEFHARNVNSDEFLWNAMKDPASAERALTRSFKTAVTWLPEEVLAELFRFFAKPSASPALWISGFPLDEVPPTPAFPGDYRLPIAEAWLLGVARCLGLPYGTLGFYTDNARGGLIRDLSPKPGLGGINEPDIHLSFHRDVPACVSGASTEPDGFILLAARGDPSHQAKTMVCSHKVLANHLSGAELAALRRSPVRAECVRSEGGAVSPYGQPFYAVIGPDEDPQITLFYIPDHTSRGFSYRVVSDDAETQDAYTHAVELAREHCDEVDLQAGDMLIINNARCNHGRTRFKPRLDGTDRWLLKTFVHAGGWARPQQLNGESPLMWPSLLMQG